MRLPSVTVWLFWFAANSVFGCAAGLATPAPSEGVNDAPAMALEPGEPALSDSSAGVEEASVKPGINDPYFQSNALDRYARILEAETREIVRRRADIVNAIGLEEGMIVADIGAGTGLFTAEIAKQVGKRGHVFSVDIVPAFLERVRERVTAEGLSNVTVVRGEERSTGLAPASLDLGFMCDTYHHIEYPQTYMNSLFRTLRPGATLVLIDMERPESQASPAVLRHVRAPKETVIEEVEQAGFVFESEVVLLEENYYLRFVRP